MPIHQRPFFVSNENETWWLGFVSSFNISFYNITQMGCFGCSEQPFSCLQFTQRGFGFVLCFPSTQLLYCFAVRSSHNEAMNLKTDFKHISLFHLSSEKAVPAVMELICVCSSRCLCFQWNRWETLDTGFSRHHRQDWPRQTINS